MNKLNELFNPNFYNKPIKIDNFNKEDLVNFFKLMTKIRLIEFHLADERKKGTIGGPVHLGIGQEAIAMGLSANLESSDYVFGAHRSHAHLLALGSSVKGLFAEILGKETGLSKGMGGSMHLSDRSVGFVGSVPIVAGTVPLAVGAGFAAKIAQKGNLSVSYLGDGATEEGVVQESLNLASLYKIPVIFMIENNLLSSHMHLSERQTSFDCSRFAKTNSIPYRMIDGNDIIEVYKASSCAVKNARNGGGPFLIEAITYRWLGHVDWREDVDVGLSRSIKELKMWKKRDPIERLENSLIKSGLWDKKSTDNLIKSIKDEIQILWDEALNDPYPEKSQTLKRVFCKK
ncbi:thiamine pyrophosphate-dependent dehydrogenase E1 component subunit alpha [Prochlorococcus marinus]|uniref:Pyruvate dehydrogenase E1 component alpha subunit n=1 Tax=Prochlorococcus marinus str. GP2 TaxID=59925 RepID=A0A0A1ZD76_PROMR|nr:thiamine pyrophosphate-dependent dehydrogenase E1 component subunit alpha [Prochlorococcus marinus]KGF86486.1 Pyruvate dehydrogenase E1 component alpha subunit [Prochlorococcus marinus str. GP2]